jgi:hypothetical protein
MAAMTDQSKPEPRDGDGLPLDVRIQTERYAMFRLLRAEAPHSRLREQWSKLETLLDTPATPQQSRDAAEGATNSPRFISGWMADEYEKGWHADFQARCRALSAAPPQPAPDAMREYVSRLKEIGDWVAAKGNAHDASALYSIARALAAPVPPADGAVPTGIYFLAEMDNFYAVATQRGCGNEFFRKWKPRWREFPQSQSKEGRPSATGAAEPDAVQLTDDQFENMVLAAMHVTMNSAAIEALTVTVSDIQRATVSAILFAKEILSEATKAQKP